MKRLAYLAVLSVLTTSCLQKTPQEHPTGRSPTPESEVDFSVPATEFAQEAQATVEALSTASFQETRAMETAAAAAAVEQTQTAAALNAQATASASRFSALVEQLRMEGVLASSPGTYHLLPPFEASWAMRGSYDFLLTDFIVPDFVLQTRVEWESAGSNIDYWQAGCGFVFRLNARGDHDLVYIGSDGSAYLFQIVDSQMELLDQGRYGDERLAIGSADVLLAVQQETISLFVDGEPVLQSKAPLLSTGYLGYAIASGTNDGFGTSCKLTDNELWILNPP